MKSVPVSDSYVLCHRYGKTFYRRRPAKYRDACTPSQQLQRGRLPGVIAFYRSLCSSSVPRIWQLAAQQNGCSGYNLFVKYNFHAFAMGGEIADYTKITLSTGTLPLPDHVGVTIIRENVICIRWDEMNPPEYLRRTDKLLVAAIYGSNPFEVCFLSTTNVHREDLSVTIHLNKAPGENVHLYVFFSSECPERYSVQRYFRID